MFGRLLMRKKSTLKTCIKIKVAIEEIDFMIILHTII